jgi:hypothetical protein
MVIDNQFRSSLQRGFSVKTHLELKYGDRVLVEGNDFATGTTLTFQHYITFKLAANGSDPLQIRMENVVIRANVADGLACMIGLQARDADSVTAPEPPRRFIVEQNISQHPADLVAARAINNGTIPQQTYAYALYKQLVTHHNTLFGPASNVDVFTLSGNRDFGNQLPGGDARVDWGCEANLFLGVSDRSLGRSYVTHNIPGTGFSQGASGWNQLARTRAFHRRNGFVWGAGDQAAKPTFTIGFGQADGDRPVDTFAQALVANDGTLQAGSPFLGADSDGGNLGADPVFVFAATARARSGGA